MILHFLAAAATNILDICIHICLYASRKCFQDTYFWCASHSHKKNTNNKCVLESIGVFFCTPSNPFAHLGKIQRQRPHCDIYEDMFILSNLSYKHVLESISSRIYTYLGLILCLWNHTTRLRCFAWTCKLTWNFYTSDILLERTNWHEIFTTSTQWRQKLLQWNLISIFTLKQNIGGTSRGFTNL